MMFYELRSGKVLLPVPSFARLGEPDITVCEPSCVR